MATIEFVNAYDGSIQKNYYHYVNRMHTEDLMLRDHKTGAIFVGGYDDVITILSDNSTYSTAPLLERAQPVMTGRVLAQMEQPEHGIKRRLIISNLGGKTFKKKYSKHIEKVTNSLLDSCYEQKSVDLVNQFGKDYAILTTMGVLGLPLQDYREIAYWHKGIAHFVTTFVQTPDEKRHSIKCSQQLFAYLRPIVHQQRTAPSDDLLSAMASAIDEAGNYIMSEDEVIALILNVLLAATEPADKTLAYLFYNILRDTELFKLLLSDRSLVRTAIHETLRLNSPVQLLSRAAAIDTQLSDVTIAKDILVFPMLGVANRDPDIFKNPKEFNIFRDEYKNKKLKKHIAFGFGMHACLGNEFSLSQIEITANILLDRLIDIRLSKFNTYEEEGIYTKGLSYLHINFS